jgi:hypothetical protein
LDTDSDSVLRPEVLRVVGGEEGPRRSPVPSGPGFPRHSWKRME